MLLYDVCILHSVPCTFCTLIGTSGKCSTSASFTAATAGMATVIVVLMLIIAVLSGAIIAFWYVT